MLVWGFLLGGGIEAISWGQEEPESAPPTIEQLREEVRKTSMKIDAVVRRYELEIQSLKSALAERHAPEMSTEKESTPAPVVQVVKETAERSALGAEGNLGGDQMIWVMMFASLWLVLMYAGVAMREAGLTRAKNGIHAMVKSLVALTLGVLVFAVLGGGLMFGSSFQGVVGVEGWLLGLEAGAGVPKGGGMVVLLVHVLLAGWVAALVSGGMAERTRLTGFVCYVVVMSGVLFPLAGHWFWQGLWQGGAGEGWPAALRLSLHDFAGGTLIHGMAGWAALAGILVVGPRVGRFGTDGKPVLLLGHHLPMAVVGTLLMVAGGLAMLGLFGWIRGIEAPAQPVMHGLLASATGGVAAFAVTWLHQGRPDPMFAMNGLLGGLVAVMAGADVIGVPGALALGGLGGLVGGYGILLLEWFRWDDAIGVVAVHGIAGSLGALGLVLFHRDGVSTDLMLGQLVGVAVVFAWAFLGSWVCFSILEKTMGLGATQEMQEDGLDFHEHSANAYPDFQQNDPV